MSVHAILNPRSAGGATGAARGSIAERLRGVFPGVQVHLTNAPRHATTLAREIAGAGATQLLVVGGDGTWHEVVDGVLAVELGSPLLLSLVPRGTGGDTRRSLGVPGDLDAALEQARRRAGRAIDAARLTWRGTDGTTHHEAFANIASVGMSAEVAERTHRGIVTKARIGALAFLVEGVGATLRPQRHHLRITLDDGPPIEMTALLCAVCNGHTFGGGMHIAPGARIDDGWLDVVWIEALPRPGVLALLPSVYPGWHRHLPWVQQRRARRVVIERETACPIEADGEVPGAAGTLTFEILPGALWVT